MNYSINKIIKHETLGERVHSLKEAVLKAVEAYNRFRSPEATAKLVEVGKDELVVDFDGSFCKTCEAYDYLEDFIYELKRFVDVEMEVLSFEDCAPETIGVRYAVKAVGNIN